MWRQRKGGNEKPLRLCVFVMRLSVCRVADTVPHHKQPLCAVTGGDADKELLDFRIGREGVGLRPCAIFVVRNFGLRDLQAFCIHLDRCGVGRNILIVAKRPEADILLLRLGGISGGHIHGGASGIIRTADAFVGIGIVAMRFGFDRAAVLADALVIAVFAVDPAAKVMLTGNCCVQLSTDRTSGELCAIRYGAEIIRCGHGLATASGNVDKAEPIAA